MSTERSWARCVIVLGMHASTSSDRSLVESDGPGSDVDLLYELAQRRLHGWEIEDLSQDLADLFGRPVDLVSQ